MNCQHRTDAGYRIEPPAYLIGSVPGHDYAIELQNLFLEPTPLCAQFCEGRACNGAMARAFLT
jgi:hypothetical protein